jgi:hypothetical protein
MAPIELARFSSEGMVYKAWMVVSSFSAGLIAPLSCSYSNAFQVRIYQSLIHIDADSCAYLVTFRHRPIYRHRQFHPSHTKSITMLFTYTVLLAFAGATVAAPTAEYRRQDLTSILGGLPVGSALGNADATTTNTGTGTETAPSITDILNGGTSNSGISGLSGLSGLTGGSSDSSSYLALVEAILSGAFDTATSSPPNAAAILTGTSQI